MRRIIKNAIQCKLCGDIIESTDRHQYVTCKCGACTVDGGHDYLRRSFKDKDCYIIKQDMNITATLLAQKIAKRIKSSTVESPKIIDNFT